MYRLPAAAPPASFSQTADTRPEGTAQARTPRRPVLPQNIQFPSSTIPEDRLPPEKKPLPALRGHSAQVPRTDKQETKALPEHRSSIEKPLCLRAPTFRRDRTQEPQQIPKGRHTTAALSSKSCSIFVLPISLGFPREGSADTQRHAFLLPSDRS